MKHGIEKEDIEKKTKIKEKKRKRGYIKFYGSTTQQR